MLKKILFLTFTATFIWSTAFAGSSQRTDKPMKPITKINPKTFEKKTAYKPAQLGLGIHIYDVTIFVENGVITWQAFLNNRENKDFGTCIIQGYFFDNSAGEWIPAGGNSRNIGSHGKLKVHVKTSYGYGSKKLTLLKINVSQIIEGQTSQLLTSKQIPIKIK